MSIFLTSSAWIFFAVTLVCVVLYTIKSIAIIKCSTLTGALLTALAFGVNTIAIKLTATESLYVSITMTVIANFLGVYIAKFFYGKFRKDIPWRISCVIPVNTGKHLQGFLENLDKYNADYIKIPYNNGFLIDIFSKTQGESALYREIVENYDIKYSVLEMDKTL